MISSIHTIFNNKKIIDYVEECDLYLKRNSKRYRQTTKISKERQFTTTTIYKGSVFVMTEIRRYVKCGCAHNTTMILVSNEEGNDE